MSWWSSIFCGIVAGIVFVLLSCYFFPLSDIHNGIWKINLIGETQSNLYSKAIMALHGPLAMPVREVSYFYAVTDDEGSPLRRDCMYTIDGTDLDTRWWSITIYGEDGHLMSNDFNLWSLTKNNIQYNLNNYQITLSDNYERTNWLPLNGVGKMYIVLRLYGPSDNICDHLSDLNLPHIKRIHE